MPRVMLEAPLSLHADGPPHCMLMAPLGMHRAMLP